MKTLSFQDFASFHNANFRIAEAAGYEFTLAQLTDCSNAQLEQFSLIFTCPTTPWLPQGSYTFVHPDMGTVLLFLVPIGPVGKTMQYESVFSRFARNDNSTGSHLPA